MPHDPGQLKLVDALFLHALLDLSNIYAHRGRINTERAGTLCTREDTHLRLTKNAPLSRFGTPPRAHIRPRRDTFHGTRGGSSLQGIECQRVPHGIPPSPSLPLIRPLLLRTHHSRCRARTCSSLARPSIIALPKFVFPARHPSRSWRCSHSFAPSFTLHLLFLPPEHHLDFQQPVLALLG
ncbi:hypothetical protein CALVIDRAFT_349457 [Calocera viscosa TUFC12733]|uniref:Uncharacterized protein n=1 Tax=Calocera viscosa (strain TUFC12733) TaxID=1330018 RepID=A0A167HA76_CALVF|nr:hypothetical protein CALVIDRAFT_349457 [Calocera viscosa TUFC12733]